MRQIVALYAIAHKDFNIIQDYVSDFFLTVIIPR